MGDKNNNRELGPQLEDLRSKGLFCDVIMVFPHDDRKMHVHKNILASCSKYFRSLFTYNMTSSAQVEVEIPGVTYGEMEAIVQYAYTHKTELTPCNIEYIMMTADRLNVLGLLKQCCDYLYTHMTTENAVGIYKLAKYLHCPVLEAKSWRFLLQNFVSIVASVEFLQLTHDELIEILKDDDLIILEDDACKALVKWVGFMKDERLAHLPQLLKAVRLGLVSEHAYKELLLEFKDLDEDSESSKLLQKGFDLCKGLEPRPALTQCLGHPMLRPRVPNEVIFVLGGWSREGVCSDMETFDNRVDKWYVDEDESYEHSLAYHAMVTLGEALYVIGGYTTVKYLNSAKKFDPVTKTWSEIAPMHTSRCYVCAAEADGYIYACGGYDGTNRHCSVEKYNPCRNQWQMVTDMNNVRSDAGAAGLNGKLYVAGGFSGTECLNTAEVYDPADNQWTLLTAMNCQRSGVTVVTFQKAIYAIGGFNGQERLSEVEKYYPDRRAWLPVKEMQKGRSNFAATVIEDRIYVIGGYDAGSGTTSHVEFYSPDQDEWREADSLKIGRSAASACTARGLGNVREFTFYGKEAPHITKEDGEVDIWEIPVHVSSGTRSGLRTTPRAKRNERA